MTGAPVARRASRGRRTEGPDVVDRRPARQTRTRRGAAGAARGARRRRRGAGRARRSCWRRAGRRRSGSPTRSATAAPATVRSRRAATAAQRARQRLGARRRRRASWSPRRTWSTAAGSSTPPTTARPRSSASRRARTSRCCGSTGGLARPRRSRSAARAAATACVALRLSRPPPGRRAGLRRPAASWRPTTRGCPDPAPDVPSYPHAIRPTPRSTRGSPAGRSSTSTAASSGVDAAVARRRRADGRPPGGELRGRSATCATRGSSGCAWALASCSSTRFGYADVAGYGYSAGDLGRRRAPRLRRRPRRPARRRLRRQRRRARGRDDALRLVPAAGGMRSGQTPQLEIVRGNRRARRCRSASTRSARMPGP